MAPTEESPEPAPIHFTPDVDVYFIRQGDTLWATLITGEHSHELGPAPDDDHYADVILTLAAQVLIEHPRWADESHVSVDRTHQFVRVGNWVLVARGLASHVRFAHEADARGRLAALALVHP